MPASVAFRMFVLGGVAVVASGYAIYRHYWVPRPSMIAPATPPTTPPDPTELPAPELDPSH